MPCDATGARRTLGISEASRKPKAEAVGELVVARRVLLLAEPLERARQPVVRVAVGRRQLHGRGELGSGPPVGSAREVGAAERLADRTLVRLEPLRALQRHRRRAKVLVREQFAAAAEAVVRLG